MMKIRGVDVHSDRDARTRQCNLCICMYNKQAIDGTVDLR